MEPGNTCDPPRLAASEFAGLYLTYACNARCAFCYVYGGPGRGGEMSVDTAVRVWRELEELAAAQGVGMRVHLAGGEPCNDWPRLLGLLRAAREAGLAPVEKIETNAGWATDDGLTRARLEHLNVLGVERLVISCDVFHQEHVPLERVQRCVRVAREVFGRGRVIVRWWDFLRDPCDVCSMTREQTQAAFVAALGQHPDRLTGRAAEQLAPLLPGRPAEAFAGENCVAAVLGSRHVHIDAYGHIFPGVCSGIILGRATPERSVGEVWRELAANWQQHLVVAALVRGGSFALLEHARAAGFCERAVGYADKCHLCADVRRWLFERGQWPAWLGPRECYGP